jgi:hypothetical protein
MQQHVTDHQTVNAPEPATMTTMTTQYIKSNFQTLVGSRVPQGCQMVCFQTKNPNLGKFWRVLQWKMFV